MTGKLPERAKALSRCDQQSIPAAVLVMTQNGVTTAMYPAATREVRRAVPLLQNATTRADDAVFHTALLQSQLVFV